MSPNRGNNAAGDETLSPMSEADVRLLRTTLGKLLAEFARATTTDGTGVSVTPEESLAEWFDSWEYEHVHFRHVPTQPRTFEEEELALLHRVAQQPGFLAEAG